MNAEQRLKERIGRILVLAGFGQTSAMYAVKDQILELFREYFSAPGEIKAEVYARSEKRIIETLNMSGVHSSSRSSD